MTSDQDNSTRDPDRNRLAGQIVQLVHGTTAPLRAWGRFFLDSEAQRRDPELAAQAFSIYFVSLFDVSDLSRNDRLPKIADEARRLGHGDLGLSADIFAEKSRYAAKVLSMVPRDLQLVVRFFRDSCVHGPLGNYSRDSISIKFAENDEIKSTNISKGEFGNLLEKITKEHGDLGLALSQAATLTIGHPSWLDEIEELIVDPNKLKQALAIGAIPFPWK